MRTRYRIDTYQKTYFVIDSYEQLMKATEPDFTPIYARLATQESIPAGQILHERQGLSPRHRRRLGERRRRLRLLR